MNRTLCIVAALVAGSSLCPVLAADRPELVVYTYESFVSEWGPGPEITKRFEAVCDCTLRFVAAGDGSALLGQLKLEGARSPADVVLGLDTNLTAQAKAAGLVVPNGIALPAFDMPVEWTDPDFVPYDWGYFAFVYDKTKLATPPSSFEALIASDTTIVVTDPRSSTPGLGLLLWIKDAYGDRAEEIWRGLAPRIVTVAPGWSEGYGLFLQGEADMALSYTTSPAYHLIAEQDDTKAAAIFTEGHYMQVEVAGISATTDQPDLAKAFLDFLLTDAAQSVLPGTNWMYPARVPAEGLPQGFETLAVPDKALLYTPEEAAAIRPAALDEWQRGLNR